MQLEQQAVAPSNNSSHPVPPQRTDMNRAESRQNAGGTGLNAVKKQNTSGVLSVSAKQNSNSDAGKASVTSE